MKIAYRRKTHTLEQREADRARPPLRPKHVWSIGQGGPDPGAELVSSPLSRVTMRAVYGASQLPRIAWYVGHSLAVRRLSETAPRRDDHEARPHAHTNLPVPDRKRLYADMAILLQQDLANVEAGFYPMPADHDGSLLTLLHRSRLFFDDLPAIHRRRESGSHSDVLTEETRGKRPR